MNASSAVEIAVAVIGAIGLIIAAIIKARKNVQTDGTSQTNIENYDNHAVTGNLGTINIGNSSINVSNSTVSIAPEANSTVPSSSTDNNFSKEYVVLYYSFNTANMPNENEPLLLQSLLTFTQDDHVEFLNKYSFDTGSYDYKYIGTFSRSNHHIDIDMSNQESEEPCRIIFALPAGRTKERLLGVLTAMSPAMLPVSFSCIAIERSAYQNINYEYLYKILNYHKPEWRSCLLLIDSYQLDMLYSNQLFLSVKNNSNNNSSEGYS